MQVKAFFVAGLTAALLGGSMATASAATVDLQTSPDAAAQASATTSASSDLDWVPSAAVGASPSIAPQAAAAAAPVWAVACTGSGKRDKIVRGGFTRKSVTARNNGQFLRGGTTNLTCGFQDNDRDTGMGYLHVAHDHGQDWSNLAALTGENWRDVADAGMVASLGNTDYAGSDPARGAMCFSGEISLINKRTGQTVKRQAVRTIVQYQSPNNIITANPGKC